MRTKEEILKEEILKLDGYSEKNFNDIKRFAFWEALNKSVDLYASQFSGSEPEGKEAVEFAQWYKDESWKIEFAEQRNFTIKQLYKIWKAEAK